MMDAEQKKHSIERERVYKEGAKKTLLRYAKELNYNDGYGGRAVWTFSKKLEVIANHTEDLEAAGFAIRIKFVNGKDGSVSVDIEHGGKHLNIYNDYYGSFPAGFDSSSPSSLSIEADIERVLAVARMFAEKQ